MGTYHNNEDLSLNKFKNQDGTIRNIADMSAEEFQAYVFAALLNDVIRKMEMAIHSDRIFSSLKYEIMGAFHTSFDVLKKGK